MATGPCLAGGAPCEVAPLPPTAGPVAKRARSVTLPDGTEIIVVGHNHGHRTVPFELGELAKKSRAELPDTEFAKSLAALSGGQPESVRHATEDLEFLRKALASRPDIRFVGVETSQSELEPFIQGLGRTRARLRDQARSRGLPASPDLSDAILLASGAAISLKTAEPGLFRGRQLIGFESPEAGRAGFAAWVSSVEASAKLRRSIPTEEKEDLGFWKAARELERELDDLYPRYDPANHDEQVLRAARAISPGKYPGLWLAWIRARLAEMQAFKRREKEAVPRILGRHQTGIVLIGLIHLDSLAGLLAKECRSRLAAGDGSSARPVPRSSVR